MKYLIGIMLAVLPQVFLAQQELSLSQCYDLGEKQSPLSEKLDLLFTQNTLDVDVIRTAKLPQFELGAKASYQSDVTEFPVEMPNFTIDPVNQDQYNATLSVNQLIFNGGLTNASARAKEAELQSRHQEVHVQLYQLRYQINQLYFSALLAQEKKALLATKKDLLLARQSEVESAVKNGLLGKSAAKTIAVELLLIDQNMSEAERMRNSSLQSLFTLIGKTDTSIQVTLQAEVIDKAENALRPEMILFAHQQYLVNTSSQVVARQNNPKLIGFATGGYGNPALNMLENAFNPYYIVGLKLKWTPFDWNASKKQQESLQISHALIERDKSNFIRNTGIELERLKAEMDNLKALIKTDQRIIELREDLLATRESQLKNGLISPSQYIDELTDLYEAKNARTTHDIQYLLAKANYLTTKGN